MPSRPESRRRLRKAGERGAVAVQGARTERTAGEPVVRQSQFGAGDAFATALLVALALDECSIAGSTWLARRELARLPPKTVTRYDTAAAAAVRPIKTRHRTGFSQRRRPRRPTTSLANEVVSPGRGHTRPRMRAPKKCTRLVPARRRHGVWADNEKGI